MTGFFTLPLIGLYFSVQRWNFFAAWLAACLVGMLPAGVGRAWRTATNAAQVRELAGMDLPRLEQAWEFTQRCTQNGGLLVVRNG